MDTNYQIGVLIARFQVHELHEGHHYLINQVMKNHKKTLIFLGVSHFVGTRKNPLDFDTRKKMIQSQYPEAVILSIPDNQSDQKWTKEIDKRIREIYPHGNPLLYGSRDSFIPYYIQNGGKFHTKELEPLGTYTGTDVRRIISEEVKNSSDFRCGVIYQAYNSFPRVIPTVTLAVTNNNRLLLCKKSDDINYRFITGFCLPIDETISDTIKRIYYKDIKTKAKILDTKYIDTIRIEDWRFKSEEDKIMTQFFSCNISNADLEPSDDIIELKYFDLSDLKNIDNNLVQEHKALFAIFLTQL